MQRKLIGNKKSKEVHHPECFCLKLIKNENIVVFNSLDEALQEKYNGCGHCLPEYNNYQWSINTTPKTQVITDEIIEEENLSVGFSVTKQQELWDIVILGAGPIGLSALKEALNIKKGLGHQLSILVIEKGHCCGSDRRAETINSTDALDKIWGKGFLENITVTRHQKNTLYSPWAKQQMEVTMLEAPHSFHWRGNKHQKGLIDSMEQILGINYTTQSKEPNIFSINDTCYLATEVEVLNANIDNERPTTTPINSIETTAGRIYGKTFLDCTGYSTPLGRQLQEYTTMAEVLDHLGSPYEIIVNPIVKSNWLNHYPTNDYPSFQSFFIPRGAVDKITDSPPGMVVIFPDNKGSAEVNFQVFDEYSTERPADWQKQVERTMFMWETLKKSYPVLSEIMSQFTEEDKEYETVTGMPCVGMLTPAMPAPGLILVGDAAGHVNPKSSSGLETGVLSTQFWVRAAWETATNKKRWSTSLKDKYNHAFINSYLAHSDKYDKCFYQDLISKHIEVNRNKLLMFGLLNWGGNEELDYWLHWAITILGYNANEKKDALEITQAQYSTCDLYQQSAIINAILSGTFVLNRAEETLLNFLKITKNKYIKEWQTFLGLIDINKLYSKVQGVQLQELFGILGPISAVEYAIYKASKWTIIHEVEKAGIEQSSLRQRVALARILLTSPPLGNKGEMKLLEILKITKEQSGEAEMKKLIQQAGGIDLFYSHVQGDERKQLQKLYPLYKFCLICSGDGRLFEAEKCQSCGGDGILKTKPCNSCGGSGQLPCWRCGGDGKIHDLITPTKCWNCNGTGKGWLFRQCVICGGDGEIFDNLPKDKSCPKCLGTGTIECWHCGGSGEIETKCWHCKGDGWTHQVLDEQDCWNCNGAGKVLI